MVAIRFTSVLKCEINGTPTMTPKSQKSESTADTKPYWRNLQKTIIVLILLTIDDVESSHTLPSS